MPLPAIAPLNFIIFAIYISLPFLWHLCHFLSLYYLMQVLLSILFLHFCYCMLQFCRIVNIIYL
nr:MAG TPA: hypothetical protein [Caudoviricetes sp.]